ncbi:hypothetical protein J6590_034556 [Homalodisca vitripennis]|nr:hypothetical protein J6590_034556 [Homalodisca vitripennis]
MPVPPTRTGDDSFLLALTYSDESDSLMRIVSDRTCSRVPMVPKAVPCHVLTSPLSSCITALGPRAASNYCALGYYLYGIICGRKIALCVRL